MGILDKQVGNFPQHPFFLAFHQEDYCRWHNPLLLMSIINGRITKIPNRTSITIIESCRPLQRQFNSSISTTYFGMGAFSKHLQSQEGRRTSVTSRVTTHSFCPAWKPLDTTQPLGHGSTLTPLSQRFSPDTTHRSWQPLRIGSAVKKSFPSTN